MTRMERHYEAAGAYQEMETAQKRRLLTLRKMLAENLADAGSDNPETRRWGDGELRKNLKLFATAVYDRSNPGDPGMKELDEFVARLKSVGDGTPESDLYALAGALQKHLAYLTDDFGNTEPRDAKSMLGERPPKGGWKHA